MWTSRSTASAAQQVALLHLVLLLSGALLEARAHAQSVPSFTPLGFLPGGSSSEPHDVSADGSTVVGRAHNGTRTVAFHWQGGALSELGDGTQSSFALTVSGDGSLVGGGRGDGHAVLWTLTTEEDAGIACTDYCSPGIGCGTICFDIQVYDLSDDGEIYTRGFGDASERVDGNGIHSSVESKHIAMSADGTRFVAEEYPPRTHRHYALPLDVHDSWSVPSSPLPDTPTGLSADGQVVAGYQGFLGNEQGYRWAYGLTRGAPGGIPLALTDSGNGMAGYTGPITASTAAVWDTSSGWRSLRTLLVDTYGLGPELAGWELRRVSALRTTADHHALVGWGLNPSGQREAWLARLPLSLFPTPPPQPPTEEAIPTLGELPAPLLALLVIAAAWWALWARARHRGSASRP